VGTDLQSSFITIITMKAGTIWNNLEDNLGDNMEQYGTICNNLEQPEQH
jgi:hypothetical protein